MEKPATIRDVAKLAGVSITTVSFVLKGIGRMSEPTIKRVWKAVNELGYTPNPYVRKILNKEPAEHQKSGLLMRISYSPSDIFQKEENLNSLIGCFETACFKYDCFGTNYIYRDCLGFRNRLLLNDLVDGVVLGLPHKEIIEMVRKRVPAVLTGINADPNEAGMPVINCNYAPAVTKVLKTAMEQGMEGGMVIFRGYGQLRFNDFLYHDYSVDHMTEPAQKCGIPVTRIDIDIDSENHLQVMEEIAEKAADLIRKKGVRFIGLHLIAPSLPLKKMLEKRGIRLPEDAVIVQVSDFPVRERGIVAINTDWQNLMEASVKVLLQRIDGKEAENRLHLVPCRHIELDALQ